MSNYCTTKPRILKNSVMFFGDNLFGGRRKCDVRFFQLSWQSIGTVCEQHNFRSSRHARTRPTSDKTRLQLAVRTSPRNARTRIAQCVHSVFSLFVFISLPNSIRTNLPPLATLGHGYWYTYVEAISVRVARKRTRRVEVVLHHICTT